MRESLDHWLTTPPEESEPDTSAVDAATEGYVLSKSTVGIHAFMLSGDLLSGIQSIMRDAFRAGVEWADENPTDERTPFEPEDASGYCTIQGQHRMVDCNGAHESPET